MELYKSSNFFYNNHFIDRLDDSTIIDKRNGKFHTISDWKAPYRILI